MRNPNLHRKNYLPYLVFGTPVIGENEIREVAKTLRSGWIGTGPKTAAFERALGGVTTAPYVQAVSSCTAALHLSLLAAGIGPGDEVITTPLTFCATANAIIHAGAVPVFVDVRPDTMNIDEMAIEAAITPRTKAIIPVHLYGRPCEMDTIGRIARKHRLTVIEDAAHAIGAEYRGKPIGSISPFTCFSFYVTKNVTTGEGGAVAVRSPKHARFLKAMSLHGMSRDAWKRFSSNGYSHYDVVAPGYKYNLTDMQASLGLHQLSAMKRNAARREKIWAMYDAGLAGLPITLPVPVERSVKHSRHLYTILVDRRSAGLSRDELMAKLHDVGIGTGVHYLPVHLHSYYRRRFGYRTGTFPNAEYAGARTLSLPLGPTMTDTDVRRVIAAVSSSVHRS